MLFFPLFWLGLMAFKTEAQAIATPPLLFFAPTLQSFRDVMARDHYVGYAINSLITSVVSTALGLAIAIPAAYSMAFFPGRCTVGLLKFMLSSRYMPGVGALMPIYICYQYAGLLDSRVGLTLMFMLMNLPIMIWLLYTSLRELPREIPRSCAHGRRHGHPRVSLHRAAAGSGRHRIDSAGVHGVAVERVVLVAQSGGGQRGHAGLADRVVLQSGRAVLGQCCRPRP